VAYYFLGHPVVFEVYLDEMTLIERIGINPQLSSPEPRQQYQRRS